MTKYYCNYCNFRTIRKNRLDDHILNNHLTHIFIYSNCAGNVLKTMFKNHPITKDKYNITYISNYDHLLKKKMENNHKKLLSNCDIFIYQPTNKRYENSEYNIDSIMKILKNTCKIIKVNYYRTRAFWYECNYKPYREYNNYSFNKHFGLYKDFIKIKDSKNKEDIINFTNNIHINDQIIIKFFESEIEKIKLLDEKSDVKMYNFFKLNYNDNLLFFDCFHPTNIFFYEMFRQLVKKILNYELPETDNKFLNNSKVKAIEMTHWTLPILPLVKKILKLNYNDILPCFHPQCHPKILYMNAYDNYYIRLSSDNFKKYLNE